MKLIIMGTVCVLVANKIHQSWFAHNLSSEMCLFFRILSEVCCQKRVSQEPKIVYSIICDAI